MSDNKRTDGGVILAVALIALGAWLLMGRVFGDWWAPARELVGFIGRLGFPLALIGIGVLVLLAAQGRLGSLGQRVNTTINGRSTPWIWSVIHFDASGNLRPLDHAIFPTYYVYKDGDLIATFPQSAPATFIALDATYQRLVPEVP